MVLRLISAGIALCASMLALRARWWSLICWMRGVPLVSGWMSVVVLLCLIGGSIQIVLGIVGEYIAKIFEEVKGNLKGLLIGEVIECEKQIATNLPRIVKTG